MDPNKEVGKRKITRYLSPDWSVVSPTKKENATHEVAIEEVTYADGRIVQYVLNGQGERESPVGTPTYDEEIQNAWKNQQTQANREQTQGERKVKSEYPGVFPPGHPLAGQPATVTEYESGEPKYVAIKPGEQTTKPAGPKGQTEIIAGRVMEYNPDTGKFDIDHGPAGAGAQEGSATVITDVEGRPGWRQVKRKEVRAGQSVEVTSYLPPGSNTEVPTLPGQEQTAEDRQPVEGHPGWSLVKRAKVDANGNKTTETVFIDPGGNVKSSGPVAPGKPVTYKGRDGKTYVQPTDPQTGMPTGEPVALANTGDTPEPKSVNGRFGYWKPDANGDPVWTDVQGPTQRGLPASVKRPQFAPEQVANSIGAFRDQLDAAVRAGEITEAEALEQFQPVLQQANLYINEQNAATRTAADIYGTQVGQRGQDVSMINQRTSAGASMANQAIGSFLPLLRYAQAGSGNPMQTLMNLMGMGRQNVEAMGGLVNPAGIGVPSAIPASQQGQPITGGAPVPGAANRGTVPGIPAAVQGTMQQQQAQVAPQQAPAAPAAPAAPTATITVSAPQGATQPVINPQQALPPIIQGAAQQSPHAAATRPWTDAETGPSVVAAPQAMQAPGASDAVAQYLMNLPEPVLGSILEQTEAMMAQDPSWGIDDLELIRQGVGPLG